MTADQPLTAVILAGGFGTRLRPVVSELPKPMAPVGQRPFLEFLLDHWLEQGVGRFILSVGYLADSVIGHFGSSYRGAAVEYVREEEPLGTGGALRLALETAEGLSPRLLMLNGDTWLAASLDRLLSEAAVLACPLTLVLTEVPANDRYGGVELSPDGRIRQFGLPADGSAALINAGCYLAATEEMKKFMAPMPGKFSLENDLLPDLARRSLIGASVQKADFIDIGVPEDYEKFCRQFS
jgi:Nucleoside-diphosphate-sugar pyrophosphorylase involved in lipopolysaccharide biosynthesis/translation initiation factor 2B, gamma/epsilon subunits (eIF-2Bgamma/eIF-2Bepsilon)